MINAYLCGSRNHFFTFAFLSRHGQHAPLTVFCVKLSKYSPQAFMLERQRSFLFLLGGKEKQQSLNFILDFVFYHGIELGIENCGNLLALVSTTIFLVS